MKRTYLWPLMILSSGVAISLVLLDANRSQGQNGGMTGPSGEPSDSFVFELELGGQVVGEYPECYGLGSSNEVEETVVQTDAGPVRQKTPGPLEWHNIKLRRNGPRDADVWAWRRAMEYGKPEDAIRDGAVVMFKAGSPEPIARWNFTKGWPASLTIEGSVEELTIVHDGIQRVRPSTYGSRNRP